MNKADPEICRLDVYYKTTTTRTTLVKTIQIGKGFFWIMWFIRNDFRQEGCYTDENLLQLLFLLFNI